MKPSTTARHSEKFILDNAYEIVVPVGRGRHSVVYKARCLPSAPVVALNGKQIALKVILNGMKGDTFHFQRTRREALALLACAHPNVVKIIDYVARESMCYLAMEYVSRSDLKQVLDKQGVPFSVETSFELTRQLLLGLEAVHRVGIVHRDIKPENLLLTEGYTLKIADFGIAYIPAQSVGIDGTQGAVGTFDYLAPECLESDVPDPRHDLYSAAVTLYQLITRELPFRGATFTEQIAHKLSGTRTPLQPAIRKTYPALEAFLDQALASDSSKRFQSAIEFRQAIEAFLTGRWKPSAESSALRPSALFTTRPEPRPWDRLPIVAEEVLNNGVLEEPSNDDSLHKLKAIEAVVQVGNSDFLLPQHEAEFDVQTGYRTARSTDDDLDFVEPSDLSDSRILERVDLEDLDGRVELGSVRFFRNAIRRRYVPSILFVLLLGSLAAATLLLGDRHLQIVPGLQEHVRSVKFRVESLIAGFQSAPEQYESSNETELPLEQPEEAVLERVQKLAPFHALATQPRAGLLYGLLSDEVDVSIATTVDSASGTVVLVVGLPGVKPVVIPIEQLNRSSQLVVPVQGLLLSLEMDPSIHGAAAETDDSIQSIEGTGSQTTGSQTTGSHRFAFGGTYEELVSGRVGSWRVW